MLGMCCQNTCPLQKHKPLREAAGWWEGKPLGSGRRRLPHAEVWEESLFIVKLCSAPSCSSQDGQASTQDGQASTQDGQGFHERNKGRRVCGSSWLMAWLDGLGFSGWKWDLIKGIEHGQNA